MILMKSLKNTVSSIRNIWKLEIINPVKLKKQFSYVRDISREEVRRPKSDNTFSVSCNLITQYNPLLRDIDLCYIAAYKFLQKILLTLLKDEIKT